ncbi:MAG: leucyl/phenylalanyl-tRNA--protein transferase [Candidatus Melainabacteria bacterium]|nr:leucyl/phenylalanyl-tRNA--protein transferase [Candidatus Melainabacteria bacterium]
MEPEFTAELVLRAYTAGIFPMGHDDGIIRWYSPDPRCIIPLDEFHTSKRLARTIRQGKFALKVNADFEKIMRLCAERESTWITDEIVRVYCELHKHGFAHSVEAYLDGQIAGGLYGVSIGGAFMGESMFHIATDASKVCLAYLVERMKERGFILLDSQYVTDHLSTFNAIQISRQEYLERLRDALTLKCVFD